MEIGIEEAARRLESEELKYILKKRGIGHVTVENVEGYIEEVEARRAVDGGTVFREIQIEFETYSEYVERLVEIIGPKRVFEQGL